MVDAPFVRALYPPSDKRKSEPGVDVLGVKRGVSRAGFWPWQEFDQDYHETFSKAVADFQASVGIKATGFYGKATHAALLKAKAVAPHAGEPALDALAVSYFKQAAHEVEKSDEQKIAERMYAYCKLFDGPYVWGGEHDGSVVDDDPHAGYDCSSSTSAVLGKFGLLGSSMAQVSGWFESWGEPGRGNLVTIHAAGDHVWIEFTIPGLAWARFDTSPHGDGTHGPRLRHKARDMSRFVSRHPMGY